MMFYNRIIKAILWKSQGLCTTKTLKKYNIANYSKHTLLGAEVNLAYNVFEPQQSALKTPIIILHGLLGSKQNWRSLGKVISSKSGRKVYALDARNHGDSPHTEEFNFPLMAHDVQQFMKSVDLSQAVIIGHSMGGRAAMFLAISKPEVVERLVVVDASPSVMHESSSSVIPGYFKAMKEVVKIIPPGTAVTQARKLAEQHMSKTVLEKGVCQFLLTNLTEDGSGGFGWKANIDVLQKTFESDVVKFPVPRGSYNGETLFICGGNSPYVREEDYGFIKTLFPKAKFIRIAGAGHWVHSEKPADFLEALYTVL